MKAAAATRRIMAGAGRPLALRFPARSSVASAVAASCSGSCTPSSLTAPRRAIWNPFAAWSQGSPDTLAAADSVAQRNAAQHAKIVEQAHRDADQHSEQLLGACLDLLELCGGTADGAAPSDVLDSMERDRIWTLVDVILHNHRSAPAEQFDLVYMALCLPAAQGHRQVQRNLLVVLHSIIPESLYRVFESVDLWVVHDDEQSMHQRDALLKFMHAQLGELHVPEGLTEAEVLSVYADDMKTLFPALTTCPAWHAVERDATTIALKAKLFALLGRLCAEFDEDHSGKVRLTDLRATADRVLGKEQAAQLLEGAPADKDGKIAYPQLAALLTRPPPKPSSAERVG